MTKAQELAESIVHRYLTLVRYQRYRGGLIQKTANISGRQLAVLRHLLDKGPRTVGQIGQFLYVRDATASAMLERMEREGYITRRRAPEDNRKVLIEPTELGRAVVAQAPPGMIWLLRERLPRLSVEELTQMEEALKKLSELAEVDESVLE